MNIKCKNVKNETTLFRNANICGKTIMKTSGIISTKLRVVAASEKGKKRLMLGGTRELKTVTYSAAPLSREYVSFPIPYILNVFIHLQLLTI